MKRKNKFIENLNSSKEDNININLNPNLNIIQNKNISENIKESEKNNDSLKDTKKENIINELKQKGFNEIQIDDILETLFRNSISDRTTFIENKSNLNIQQTHTIDMEVPPSIKLGMNQGISHKNKKMENINSNSKYKNSFIIKTENSDNKNNNNIQNEMKYNNYNCAKIYINASSEKNREYYLNSSNVNNIDKNENKNKGKMVNFKKYRNVPHITSINMTDNIPNSTTHPKKINTKYMNYLNKFSSQQNNHINYNRNEGNKMEILKKFEYEMNNNNYRNQRNSVVYNNYNFKMIFDSKKFKERENMENIGYVEIVNNSSRDGNSYYSNKNLSPPNSISGAKSRNSYKEENKDNSNSFSIKQKILSSLNQLSLELNEIKEEKENNEIINKDNNKENEKYNKRRNKGKFNTLRKNKFKKKKKIKQDDIINNNSNKFTNTKKIFSSINSNKKEMPKSSKVKKNNIFMIRKQKTEEEEKLAKKI